jgi:hypothetical protein
MNLGFCKVAGLPQPGKDIFVVFDSALVKQTVSNVLDEAANLEEADEAAGDCAGKSARTSDLFTLTAKA